jgi:hypothetical protein
VGPQEKIMIEIEIGDRVRIHLDEKFGQKSGWYEGTVFKIDPYSRHRNFYWVKLDDEVQAALGLNHVSVFNPRNIQKLESK